MTKSNIIIQSMRAEDIPACVRVLMDNDLWRQYGITALGAEQMLTTALAEGANIITAKLNGETAGFAWGMPRGAFAHSAYLRLIGVLPEFHRMGIGEALLQAVEEMASHESGDIFLLVTANNEAAQRFYLQAGYHQAGAIPNYVVEGVTELIFHKRLIGK